MKQDILILLTHSELKKSKVNKILFKSAMSLKNIYVHHLEESMVDGHFDLEKEQNLLKKADTIVWQFPLYWYSAPPALRIWQDQVLSSIVYSEDKKGNFLKGKKLLVAFTAGAAAETYTPEGFNRYTADEMLRPFEMTAISAGMVWQKPFAVYNTAEATANDLEKAANAYVTRLRELS